MKCVSLFVGQPTSVFFLLNDRAHRPNLPVASPCKVDLRVSSGVRLQRKILCNGSFALFFADATRTAELHSRRCSSRFRPVRSLNILFSFITLVCCGFFDAINTEAVFLRGSVTHGKEILTEKHEARCLPSPYVDTAPLAPAALSLELYNRALLR